MSRWRVDLVGHEFDLEDLPTTFAQPPVRVLEEDGHYYLEADEFDELSDAAAVRTAAQKLVTDINGSTRLRDSSRRNVEAGPVHEMTAEGGGRTAYVDLAGTAEGRAKVHATMEGGKPAPPEPDPATRWRELASQDSDVAEAMDIWANRDHDWVNLNKIVEIVESRGGLSATGVSKAELRRFKHTANHEAAAGRDARHARSRKDPPKNPMTQPEADDLVGRTIREWLDSL